MRESTVIRTGAAALIAMIAGVGATAWMTSDRVRGGPTGTGADVAETIDIGETSNQVPATGEDAAALLRIGDLGGAEGAFQAEAVADSADLKARLGLTFLALMANDAAEARRRAEEVTHIRLDGAETRAAEAAVSLIDGNVDAAANEARAALASDPSLLLARWVLAQTALTEADFCGAAAALRPAIADAPGLYKLHELQLFALNRAGDWEASHRRMLVMHQQFPSNIQVASWLFESLDGRGEEEAATQVLRDIARTTPDDLARAVAVADYVRRRQGDPAAEAELDRLAEVASSPSIAIALRVELARSLLRRGETKAGLDRLQVIEESVEATPDIRHDVQIVRAVEQRTNLDAVGALVILDDVLEEDPTHIDALKMKGELLIETGRNAAAVDVLSIARGVAPSDTLILLLLAQAFEADRKPALAQDVLARAVELSNNGLEEVEAFTDFLTRHGQERIADRLGLEQTEATVSAAAPSPDSCAL